MRRLNIAVCGLIFAAATATLVSCQDIVTYNDGYDDGMTSMVFHPSPPYIVPTIRK